MNDNVYVPSVTTSSIPQPTYPTPVSPCPLCGYCPHCGRTNPTYPTYSQPYYPNVIYGVVQDFTQKNPTQVK